MEATKEQALKAMETLELEQLHKAVQDLVSQGCDTYEIEALLQQGMQRVSDNFTKGEYFLADLIFSGRMFESALKLLVPESQLPSGSRGKVLVGVVAGDIHNIGKDIVVQRLKIERFDVLDLGVDVPAEAFVEAALEHAPDVIALGGIIGKSATEMKRVIDILTEAKVHPATPIMVGGACIDKNIADKIGATSYIKSPVDAVNFCKNIMENKNKDE